MTHSPDVLACVEGLLTQRLEIIELERRSFHPGSRLASSVVNSYRLLFVRSGVVHYAMEGWKGQIAMGTLLLVPAWMKRGWRAGARAPVDLQWISFNPAGEAHFQDRPFAWPSDNAAREARAFNRMLAAWQKSPVTYAVGFMIEGELKALLGRLAHGCHTQPSAKAGPSPEVLPAITKEIITIAAWIEHHHARPDVLSRAAAMIRSSDHYFRFRFRERTGFTLGQFTAMVRLRRARYLLSSSATPIKDIAWQVGFRDPLHFSRCYRKFWGHAPRHDRHQLLTTTAL